MAGYTVILSMI